MNQLELQRTMFDAVAHLYAEFGDLLRSGELAAFLLVASHENISITEIARQLNVSERRALTLVAKLCPRDRWWHRRLGLIRVFMDEDGRTLRCLPTLKGALVGSSAINISGSQAIAIDLIVQI